MVRKLYVTVLLLIASTSLMLAQQGILKGTVKDKKTGEGLPFTPVVIYQGSAQVGGAQTDFNGDYTIKPVAPGKYTVKATSVGYQPIEVTNVIIKADQTTYINAQMATASTELGPVEVVEYKVPLIDPSAVTGNTVTREDFSQMATKNVLSVAATTAGIYQQDEGGDVSVRGSRTSNDGTEKSATDIYVDGVKVRGGTGVPQSAVDQVSVITGGVPANFGDVTGGVISITTRGPSSVHAGGVELITSQYLDKFNYNFIGLNASGPILFKTDTATKVKRPFLGYLVAAQFETDKDPNPSAVGAWKVKDDTLAWLEKNPLRRNPNGGTIQNADYIRLDDLEHIDARQNVRSNTAVLTGKIDMSPSRNLNVTVGGSYEFQKYHSYTYEYSLFNPFNNPEHKDQTYRIWGRVTQKFLNAPESTDKKSSATIKNAFYSLQVSYDKVYDITQDDNHTDNFFNYGYIGKFQTLRQRSYGPPQPDSLDPTIRIIEQDGFEDTLVTFTPDTLINPTAAAYTSQYYDIYAGDQSAFRTLNDVQSGGGLRNGDRPINVYNLWYSTGRQYNGYLIEDRNQYRLTTSFSADIKDHAIILGFEYEQRDDRAYSLSPIGLWGLGRQLANSHIREINTDVNDSVFSNGVFTDTINHPRIVDKENQNFFDKMLREKLGAEEDEMLDVDNQSPDTYSLSMFTADDLLGDGVSPYVSYYGYDHTGKKNATRPTFDDFFTKKDEHGNFSRPIDAFRPIYMAGYITDNFDFRDLKFRVGLRVDRYDANQKVLKDKYSLYDTKKAGELDIPGKPSNIGNDYVVYVSDKDNPTPEKVVGYRNGDTWYNQDGVIVNDPTVLHSSTGIAPYLVNPKDDIKDSTFVPSSSFVDYKPQINLMPRIAFSFPISDMAKFNANYDVLTQRPSRSNRLDPVDYLFMAESQGYVNNPDLKPEKSVNYEIGFQQILNERQSSKLGINAYYSEKRDMVQVVQVFDAYPKTYNTYGNRDFGTVKGFTLTYDLRRTGNVRMTANYTLQFADATASGATEAATLIQAGFPNLRTVHRMNIDQRHRIVVTFDYRYSDGKDYNGPVWFGKQVFSNAGANFTLNAGSGTPYSRQVGPTMGDGSNVAINLTQNPRLKGDVNGADLPWQYRVDMKLDKSFDVKFGESKDGEAKIGSFNVYLLVLNLFNTANVNDVYRFTGLPGDDGYLQAAQYQSNILATTDPTSFQDQYRIKVNNPAHYSLPRRIRLGMTLNF